MNLKIKIGKIRNTRVFILLFAIAIIHSGCDNTLNSKQELLQWMSDADHGLVKSKSVNGLKLTAKYLPPEYLTLKELNFSEVEKSQYDSIFDHYSSLRTFLLTIGPDGKESSNVMFHNLISTNDYKQRVERLNFDIASFISVKTSEGEHTPVLFTLENTYELASHKSIYLVFSGEDDSGLLTASKLDLKFTDELFGTGISHFVFDKNKIDAIPEIVIKNDN